MIASERLKQLEGIHYDNLKNSQRTESVLPDWSPEEKFFGLVIASAELSAQLRQFSQNTVILK